VGNAQRIISELVMLAEGKGVRYLKCFVRFWGVCDAKAERDPDKTSRMLVISILHPKYAFTTDRLGSGTNIFINESKENNVHS
jgi:hypothetical protein